MPDGQAQSARPVRPWKEIAEELAREQDSVRVMALSEELMRSLDLEKKVQRNSA